MAVLTAPLDKITDHTGEIASPLFLVLRRFQNTKLNLSAISATVGEMSAGIFISHKLRCPSFDGQGRNSNYKFIDSVTLMQLIDGFGIDICFAGACFHLDV